MKAIVMAGGEGTRLRPLTEGRPKPMVELLGAPILERTVELLKNNGFTDIRFTLRYLPKVVEDWFGDGERFGVKISCSVETRPLGTAGGVRACREFAGGEPVLVMSGDGVCNFDLRGCVSFFEKKSADAAIVLYEHPEPTRFGLVLTDPDGRVTAFSEKPSWDRVVTSMVNTGIYILSPEVLDMIPDGEPYDFGKDLFPRLLREGKRLFAMPAGTYWCDVGSPEAYRQCCVDIVSGRVGMDLKAPEVSPGIFSRVPLDGVRLTSPVYVGEGCRVEPGASLGPGAVLSAGSSVGRDSTVRESVLNGAYVGAGCAVEGAIVGRDAKVGGGARIGRECVVGDGARLGENCVLAPGVRVWTGRRVQGGRRLAKSLTGDAPAETGKFLSDSVLTGVLGASLTPETALALGSVLGKDGRIGAAFAGGPGARLFRDALLCGVTAAGGDCCRIDALYEAQLAGASKLFALSGAVFVRERGEELAVTFFTGAGTAIGREKRGKLQAALTGGATATAPQVGGVSSVSGAARAYISGVLEEVRALAGPGGRGPVSVAVTGGGSENRALRCVLAGLGFTVGRAKIGTASFCVSEDGFDLTAVDEQGREADPRHTVALAALCLMRLGTDRLALPEDAPAALERMAARYGCRLIDPRTEAGKALWENQRSLRDGAVKAALIASVMAREGVRLSQLYDDLPTFTVEERQVELPASPARLMRLMTEASAETASELAGGLRIATTRGQVRVAPSFDGAALRFTAEAGNAETAEELCLKAESLARELSQKDESGGR